MQDHNEAECLSAFISSGARDGGGWAAGETRQPPQNPPSLSPRSPREAPSRPSKLLNNIFLFQARQSPARWSMLERPGLPLPLPQDSVLPKPDETLGRPRHASACPPSGQRPRRCWGSGSVERHTLGARSPEPRLSSPLAPGGRPGSSPPTGPRGGCKSEEHTLSQNGYGGRSKADSTQRSSQAVPHPSTNRALCRLTSEVRRDPVFSITVWPSAKSMITGLQVEDLNIRGHARAGRVQTQGTRECRNENINE